MGKAYQIIFIFIIAAYVGACVYWIQEGEEKVTLEEASVCMHKNNIHLRSDYKACTEENNQCRLDVLLKVCKK